MGATVGLGRIVQPSKKLLLMQKAGLRLVIAVAAYDACTLPLASRFQRNP